MPRLPYGSVQSESIPSLYDDDDNGIVVRWLCVFFSLVQLIIPIEMAHISYACAFVRNAKTGTSLPYCV